ncbi:FMN-binding protein [Streptococcus loxodontisalivarius]|uniref:Uncharacterized protein with FMN-binding domain n=1 Tax=Streptococcus loxodontisalivarius TaxID=1349415 RepID=A0ABS2PUZ9_9STRE|nr:FMN-binding protein [Streptococcus loxodontisalivarius]MBM7643716.1 uncharacterized protein with FMN-binding domain [Streptococcus loxodontisalivarius]
MKKQTQNFILGGTALTALAANAYFLWAGQGQARSSTAIGSSISQASSDTTSRDAAASSTDTSSFGLKDGSYTGAVTSTNRGDYQVQITVVSGQITAIDVLEYPNENSRSQQINGDALPIYTEEALASQSASISQISGATEAYKGFTGSLQDAINQAQV